MKFPFSANKFSLKIHGVESLDIQLHAIISSGSSIILEAYFLPTKKLLGEIVPTAHSATLTLSKHNDNSNKVFIISWKNTVWEPFNLRTDSAESAIERLTLADVDVVVMSENSVYTENSRSFH